MSPRRVTLLVVCAFAIFLAAVGALVVRQASGGDVDSTLWMNAVLIVIGLLILARATLGPTAAVVPDRCDRCGGRTFDTARSLDRRMVRTCFSCGSENTPSGIEARAEPNPATRVRPPSGGAENEVAR